MLDSRGFEHTEDKGDMVLSGDMGNSMLSSVGPSRSGCKLTIAYARLPQKSDPLSTSERGQPPQGAGVSLGHNAY